MELRLDRVLRTNKCTIGELYVDGNHICDTLEDVVRPLPETCPNTTKGINCKCKEKVYGSTAIPAGTYEVKLTHSNRFKRVMPEICNIPHFLGIRIHSLNRSSETEGCIGVGNWDGITEDYISNSRFTYNKLFKLLENASGNNEPVSITINNI